MQHSHVRKNSWIRFESNRSIRIRKHFWIKVKKLVRFDYQYLQFYRFNFDTVLSSSSLIIQQIVIRSGVKNWTRKNGDIDDESWKYDSSLYSKMYSKKWHDRVSFVIRHLFKLGDRCQNLLFYIHTYIHAYIHTYIHIYIHTYMRIYTHTHMRAYIHIYSYILILTFILTLMLINILILIHIQNANQSQKWILPS